MGLDSLSAMSLSARLFDQKGIDLPTSVMLRYHTIREWAQHIQSGSVQSTEQELQAQQDVYPSCDNQMRLFVEWTLQRDSTQYNMPQVRFYKGVSVDRLKKALTDFLAAHPYVKTHFENRSDGLVQLRADGAQPQISVAQLATDDLLDFFQQRVRPFDLLAGPLYRFEAYTAAEGCYLFTDFHHAIFDGISYSVFFNCIDKSLQGNDLQKEAYTAFDYAVAQEKLVVSAQFAEAEKYFAELVASAEVAVFHHSVQPDTNVKGKAGRQSKMLEASGINDFCKKNQITQNSFFVSALAALLHRVCGEESLLFTYVDSGREQAALYGSVGMFVRTLPVVSEGIFVGDETFANAAAKMQTSLAEGIAHGIYPYSKIVSRIDRRPEIIIAFEGGVWQPTAEDILLETDTAKMPLSVVVALAADNSYRIEFEYDASIYCAADVDKLLDCYCSFAQNLLLGKRLKDTPMVSSDEKAKLIAMSKGKDLEYNQNETFVDMVLRHAAQNPDNIALKDSQGSLTYRQFDELSNALAHSLIANGVEADDFVCLSLPRTKEFVVAILGVMRAGAAYVPVDLDYPAERQEYMKSNSQSRLTITEEFLAQALKEKGKTSESINRSAPQGRAYMIYTSGSTGKPKGVVIQHIALRAFIAGVVDMLCITSANRHLELANFSFDASGHDLFPSLAQGAMLVVANDKERKDLAEIDRLIVENQIDNATMPTQLGMLYANTYPQSTLKNLVLGGEKLLPTAKTNIQIINGYGPTEFTVGSSYHFVDQDVDVDIPIGRPVPNSYSFICGNFGQLLPQGFAGELTLCGDQIAAGYWNRPNTTAAHFVPCPFLPNQKMYRTGDLCRYNDQGNLEYLGRIDGQVKLRGFRIELGEIDSVASNFYGVKAVSAQVKKLASGVQELCLYFSALTTIDTSKYREFLQTKLPEYMVPYCYVQLENMPLTPNGKINGKALPLPEVAERQGRIAATEVEQFFVDVFKEVLNLDEVFADDSFFDIGGSSLDAIRVVVAAEDAGRKITYADVFKCKTPEALAALFAEEKPKALPDSEFEDLSLYDYTEINKLLAGNTLHAFATGKRQTFSKVLLLGSTGYLGVHVLNRLLVEYPDVQIVCLVRPSDGLSALNRLISVYTYYFGQLPPEHLIKCGTIVAGDIANKADLDKVLDMGVDTVFNMAANVKHFSQGNDIAIANYLGVLNVVDFCQQCGARLVHISTSSVAGVSFGDMVQDLEFRENELYKGQKQISKYTHSKFLAERAVLQAVACGKLQAQIVRVGNLMPRLSDGLFQINAATNSFMAKMKASYIIGAHLIEEEYVNLEFSPIDLSAHAILLLARAPRENVVFHAYNNNQDVMGSFYDCMNAVGFKTEGLETEEFMKRFDAVKNNPEIASFLSGMIAYDFGESTKIMPLRPVANFTQRVLAMLDFRWPLLGRVYMERFLASLGDIGFFMV